MGPGDGIQIQRLMDLPTTLETAEPGERGPSVAVEMRDSRSHSQTKHSSLNQSSSSGISLASQQINQQGVQRVKSLLQTSAKLPSRLPPGGHSGPIAPQRSVSHNETGMRNYYNGGSSGETPPGSMQGRANQGVGPGSSSSSGSLFMGGPSGQRRSTSTSLPRSPDPNELGGFGGTGSVSSQDSHQGNYANIYQNVPSHTSNHSSMFDMTNTTTSTTVGGLIHEAGRSPRHSLGSNNSSNLSSPPSPHIRDGNTAGNNQ